MQALAQNALSTSTRSAHLSYYGCPVFAPGDYYNANISSAPVDPHSAEYIASAISAGDTMGFYASTGVEEVNHASSATPLLRVKQDVSYHKFPLPYPWSANFYIEPLSDRHAIVAQLQSCHLYESVSTDYSEGVLSAYSGANWNLSVAFAPLPAGNPSAMSSGLSLFAGMVRWEDYEAGHIEHALNWDSVVNTASQHSFVRPASSTDGLPFNGNSAYELPWGAHLRLKASFPTTRWGPQATMVANAMKTYGIYLADSGHTNGLYFANLQDGSNPWNRHDLASLASIHLSDFDVLKLGTILEVDHRRR